MKVVLDSVNSSGRELVLIREAFGDTVSVQVSDENEIRTVTVDAAQLRHALKVLAYSADYDTYGTWTMPSKSPT